jgi:putative membrane protein
MGLVFIAAVGLIVYLVVRGETKKKQGAGDAETPLDIAKKRYARGEITREQFEQLKKDLS